MKLKKKLVTKWNSSGNTFILLMGKGIVSQKREKLSRSLCGSLFGLSADGCLFLEKAKYKNYDYRWDFYNSDGSKAEMCGNAARAADQFCRDLFKEKKKRIIFSTAAGLISTFSKKQMIHVEMPTVERPIKISRNLSIVNTGVPHAVWKVENIAKAAARLNYIRRLRKLKVGKQKGFNVTLLQTKKGDQAFAVTFERGVEGFTLSCGTGAVAASIVSGKSEIFMPGGKLQVIGKNHNYILIGKTNLVCKAEVNL